MYPMSIFWGYPLILRQYKKKLQISTRSFQDALCLNKLEMYNVWFEIVSVVQRIFEILISMICVLLLRFLCLF